MTSVAHSATPARARTGWVAPALIFLITLVVARWASAPYLVGVFHDDGIYAMLARSIAAGDGFQHSHLPGAPAATHYPPLYPLLLAAAWRIAPAFPENVPFLLGINCVLVAAAACGWWWFARSRLGWRSGAAVAGAIAITLSSPVLTLSAALLSEPLFIACLWPMMLLCERSASATGHDRVSPALTGAAIGLLMLVRTHAVALFLAVLFVLLVRRRLRDAALVAAAAVLLQLPWIVWTMVATPRVAGPLEGSYGSYVGWLITGIREGGVGLIAAAIWMNLVECWRLLQDRVASGFPMPLHVVTMSVLVLALGAGIWSFARRAPVTIAFLALYLAIVVVVPYTPWRYVLGVWPLIALIAAEGVRSAYVAVPRARVAIGVLAALPAFAFARVELGAYAARSWRAPSRAATAQILPAVAWVRANTDSGDVVVSQGESVIALYANRRAAPPVSFTAIEYVTPASPEQGRQQLGAMLAAVRARYVILLSPALQASAGLTPELKRTAALPYGTVYEVVR